MKRDDLIAPERYNISMEMERFAEDPSRKALVWLDDAGNRKEVTYTTLMKRVNQIGNVFYENGLQKGDKVLVMIPRLIDVYEVYLAGLKTGIIIIPSSEMLKTNDLEYRIQHGEAKAVVSYFPYVDRFKGVTGYDTLKKFVVGEPAPDWQLLDEMKEETSDELEMADTSRDDIAFLPYTSGTTGNPKGVVHTHGWGYAHLNTAARNWLSIDEGDKVWATAGPGWQKWIWSPFLSVLGVGATGFIYHGKFDAKTYLQLLQDEAINALCCTPTEYRLMSKADDLEQYNLEHLHSAVSAGEPLNREVIDTFRKYFNLTVRDGYGQTENSLLLGFMKGMDVKPGSMGKPTPGNVVEVVDEDGSPVTTGSIGDIAVRLDCPSLFKEYYKDTERTDASRRGNYYVTGDQATKDNDGYFWFEGRSDDIIISSGYTIGPFEVEDALVRHPLVQECAVVASPDEVRGAVVKAYVVLKPNVDASDPDLVKNLQDHAKETTAPYKYPRRIEFTGDLPKTMSGKIRRVELRQKEWQKVNK